MSDTGAGGGGDDPDPRYARISMGVRLLGDAIRRRRGEQGLSQKAAARAWGFPYSTLCALETATVRNYQVANITRLDDILGLDAWALLQQSDHPGLDQLRAEMDELRSALDELRSALDELRARIDETGEPTAGILEGLGLTEDELGEVVAFAYFLIARRRG